jgi:benzoate/toluate 1,2-dioxygenase beta subunit
VSEQLRAVEAFLYKEARLLDEGRFTEWLALFDERAWYWAPVDPATPQADRGLAVALIDEDRTQMEARIGRFALPNAYSEQPMPRASRHVSNVAILENGAERLTVFSKLAMHVFRLRNIGRSEHRDYAASVRHGLRTEGDDFRILWKRVDLVDAEDAHTVMSLPF